MLFCRAAMTSYVDQTDNTPSAKLWISTLDNITANTTDIKSEVIDLMDPSVACNNFTFTNIPHLVEEYAISGYILNQTMIFCGCYLNSDLPNKSEWRCAVPVDLVIPGKGSLNSGLACETYDRAVFLNSSSLLVISKKVKYDKSITNSYKHFLHYLVHK